MTALREQWTDLEEVIKEAKRSDLQEMLCDRISSAFPKLLSNGLLLYTFLIVLKSVTVIPKPINSLILTALLSLTMYTYWRIISIGAGSPLDYPMLKIKNLDDVMNRKEVPPKIIADNCILVKSDGSFRFCKTCMVWKPDRAHHCSKCNVCVLKMDHHCPWFAGCVGFRNAKFFIQFLSYLTLYALYVFMATCYQIYSWFVQKQYQTEILNLNLLIVSILSMITSIANLAFTLYTVWLATKNETTLETYQWNDVRHDLQIFSDSVGSRMSNTENVFDLGSRMANLNSVMGTTWKEWILPIIPYFQRDREKLENAGLHFPMKKDRLQIYRQSVELQQRLLTRFTPRSSLEHI